MTIYLRWVFNTNFNCNRIQNLDYKSLSFRERIKRVNYIPLTTKSVFSKFIRIVHSPWLNYSNRLCWKNPKGQCQQNQCFSNRLSDGGFKASIKQSPFEPCVQQLQVQPKTSSIHNTVGMKRGCTLLISSSMLAFAKQNCQSQLYEMFHKLSVLSS